MVDNNTLVDCKIMYSELFCFLWNPNYTISDSDSTYQNMLSLLFYLKPMLVVLERILFSFY
jgi:hypothetical protein